MPSFSPERLRQIRDFPGLLAFLSEDLHWPLPADPAPDDVTFEWDADDLRLAAPAAARLRGGLIRQLRPLHAAQPWGVFFVEFNEPRLYRTALRQILRRLVPNRRRDAAQQSWRHDNLLFVCATRDYRQISFAHFRGGDAGRARLASFGWDAGDERGLRTLREFNLPPLAYPARPADAAAWSSQWAGAFDVEPVTREFFKVYKDIFERVEASVAGLADLERRRLWTQRLFNRLLFIAFIEKKGWLTLGGRSDYLAALWEAWSSRTEPTGLNFYNARLRLLFFQALNNPQSRNVNADGNTLLRGILGEPVYLNGGLFEQDTDDADPAVTVPDLALGAIFTDLFERFNFTVTESTPLDVEVAVDPEMLGKVFEELVTGRHESGSYYTPKPIVAFMCREALKHYLAGALPAESPAALARFVDAHDAAALADGEQTLRALQRVRVCDPACGSGAYLLGMLHELIDLRACLFATGAPDAASVHARKLGIIQENLYGVDLDPFAVNIARLRLWLSLAVDAAEALPLPNLDFKIEAGDSLAAPDPHGAFASSGQGSLRDEAVRRFQAAKSSYLSAQGDAKRALKETIAAARGDLAVWLASQAPAGAFDWAVEFAEIFAPRPPGVALDGGLNLGDTLARPPEPGGFDIVLANPPYVRQELIKAQKPVLKARYECYEGTADLLVYFYERAAKILKPGGTLAFISSNKFYRAGYGKKLRTFLARETSVKTLVDFGDAPVFGAIAYASILIAMRTRPAPGASAQALTWTGGKDFERVGEIVAANSQPLALSELSCDGWRLESTAVFHLLAKLRAVGTTLGEYVNGRLYYGLKTGLNDAFIVDRSMRDKLIETSVSSGEVLKPYLRGRDVKRWAIHSQDLWLIFIPWHFPFQEDKSIQGPSRTAEREFEKRYPAIYGHLTQFRSQLLARNVAETEVRYEWYALQRWGAEYWREFSSPKIVYPNICKRNEFTWDDDNYHTNQKTFIIAGASKFLLAILNSAVVMWLFTKLIPKLQNGFYEPGAVFLREFPIPDATPTDQAALTTLVDGILAAKRAGDAATVRTLEAEIDTHVFRLYSLTPDEQALILDATASLPSS